MLAVMGIYMSWGCAWFFRNFLLSLYSIQVTIGYRTCCHVHDLFNHTLSNAPRLLVNSMEQKGIIIYFQEIYVENDVTLVHQPAHISSYLPIGWPSPISPKYIAGPMRSLLNPRFIPHIGNRVPLGIVMTASTYLHYKITTPLNQMNNQNKATLQTGSFVRKLALCYAPEA